jgi:hypothetical protein
MLDEIYNRFKTYSRELPRNMTEAAFKSAAFSFAISAILSGNVQYGVNTGALAGTVSLICGLTRPLFRKTFGENMKWYENIVSLLTSVGITQILLNALSYRKVDLISGSIATIALTLFVNRFNDVPTRVSPTFIFV